MTANKPTISVLPTKEQIAAYKIEPVTSTYKGWNTNKIALTKNTIIKTVFKFRFLGNMFES